MTKVMMMTSSIKHSKYQKGDFLFLYKTRWMTLYSLMIKDGKLPRRNDFSEVCLGQKGVSLWREWDNCMIITFLLICMIFTFTFYLYFQNMISDRHIEKNPNKCTTTTLKEFFPTFIIRKDFFSPKSVIEWHRERQFLVYTCLLRKDGSIAIITNISIAIIIIILITKKSHILYRAAVAMRCHDPPGLLPWNIKYWI